MNIHPVHLEKVLCSVYRTAKSDCARCSDVCPAGAVRITSEGPRISEKCTECGTCISACPNGAISAEGLEEEVLGRELVRKFEQIRNRPFRISCRRGDSVADMVLPCLGRLTEGLLLMPIKLRKADIVLLRPECTECDWRKTALQLDKTIENARDLCGLIDESPDRVSIHEVPLRATSGPPEKSLSRRRFLGALGKKAVGAAAEALPALPGENRSDENKKVFRETLQSRVENQKRSLLLEVLAGPAAVKEIAIPAAAAIVAEIAVDERCTGCRVCATLCPTGAIVLKESDRDFVLRFKANQCTNCGVCTQSCVHGALRRENVVQLNNLQKDTETQIFKAVKKSCRVCESRFVGSRQYVCLLCGEQAIKQQRMAQVLTPMES